jgi:preprotein translocase subunit SecE
MAEDDCRKFDSRGTSEMAKTSPMEFFRQVRAEAGKVVWPTWPETSRTAIFVAIMMVILAVFFLGIDSIFGSAVRWLLDQV